MLQSRSNIVIRKGEARDAAGLAAIFTQSWKLAYAGIIPDSHLEGLILRRDRLWWRRATAESDALLVLEIGGTLAGYVTFGRARSKGRYQGEIYELYLDPTHQGLGFGEHLFEAARHALDQRRLSGLIIWALSENTQACDFYWRRGGRPVAKLNETMAGRKLEKIAFAWS